jgi:hypothetical protein
MAKVRIHSPPRPARSSSPTCPQSRDKRRSSPTPIAMTDGAPFGIRLPLEKAVHRHDAAPRAGGVAKRRQVTRRLALGVNRLAAALPIASSTKSKSKRKSSPRSLLTKTVRVDPFLLIHEILWRSPLARFMVPHHPFMRGRHPSVGIRQSFSVGQRFLLPRTCSAGIDVGEFRAHENQLRGIVVGPQDSAAETTGSLSSRLSFRASSYRRKSRRPPVQHPSIL